MGDYDEWASREFEAFVDRELERQRHPIFTRWQDLRERIALWIAPWLESPDFKEDA